MITTDFVPGSPCWLDLGAPDVAAAAAFYGSVFGWEYQSVGPEGGDYGFFRLDGKTVGGIGALTEEGARSAWMIYFNAPDVEATAEAVQRLGGTVRVAPMGNNGEGRMAQFTDPLGGQFAVLQPGKMGGLEAVDQPGTLSWIELYTTDAAAAKEFYGTLFGWQTQDVPLPGGGGTYALITPAGLSEERMHGGLMQLPAEHLVLTGGRAYWHPVFAVADCDAAVARVTENGGTVQMGPEDAEGVGRLAVCLDPSGADFVVLAPTES
jgi:predicted enzyme related to lactoylglutathione lyase